MPMMTLVRRKDRWRRSRRLQLRMLMMSPEEALVLVLVLGSEPPRKGRCRKNRRQEMLLAVPLETK
jgi:hypothetical protein